MATATVQKPISLLDMIRKLDKNVAPVDTTLIGIGGLNFEVQAYGRKPQLLWSRIEKDSIVIRAGYVRNRQSGPTNSVHFSYITLIFNREGAFRYAVEF